MQWAEVLRRIDGGEDQATEFKRGLGDLGGIGRTLCAFANGDGGLLILGVDDAGAIIGVREAPDRVQERLASFLHSGCSRPVSATCGRHRSESGWVHWVAVPRHLRGYEPFSHDGRFWLRRSRATVAPSPSELQELLNAFGLALTEKQVIASASPEDIAMGAFRSFMRDWGRELEDLPQPKLEDDLRNTNVCGMLDGELRPTLYGLAHFGLDFQAHPHTSCLFIQCAAYAGTDRASSVLSAADAKGRLSDQVKQAMGWFRSLGHGERYSGLYREDIPLVPDAVIREALVNAVIHRSYAITGASVMLEVFSDRVDITSPGTLPNHMTAEEARSGGAVRSRNELIATAMVVLGMMERRGRGWLLMRRAMREFNGTEPELVNSTGGDYVRVTIRL